MASAVIREFLKGANLIVNDLGYGYTKAVTRDKQISFPSVITQDNIPNLELGFGSQLDYSVSIRTIDGNIKKIPGGRSSTND